MPRRGKRKREWPVQANLYWCPTLNIPVLGRECSGGAGEAVRLRLTEPGDARPAMEHDLRIISEAYEYEVGSREAYESFIGESVVLLNKVPFMDLMYEVVSDGLVIGRVYWDPLPGKWRLRFSLPGLKRIWGRVDLPKYPLHWGIKALARARMFNNTINARPYEQVVFVDEKTGDPVGIGYVLERGDKIKLHSAFWRDWPERLGTGKTTWDDVVKGNEYYLYYYTSRAVKFIHVMNEKVGKPVIVSYSGGKDSLVSLHLTLRTGIRPYLLFNDTGIEMPQTRRIVEETARKYGLELLKADAGDSFWRAVERVGPPGKDYRWCCKVTKLAPLARLLEEKFPDGALNIVGQRAFESLDRARSPRVWRNRWISKILNISPIQEWPQLLVWLYIWKEKLEYNPLYERGFDRIGCYMCPAAFSAEYEFVKEAEPQLWKKWESKLEAWSERIGLEGEARKAWVEKGLWRWLTPAAQKMRLAYRLRVELSDWRETYRRWLEPSLVESELDNENMRAYAVFSEPFDPESLRDQYSVLGAFQIEEEDEDRIVLSTKAGVRVRLDNERIEVEGARGVLARELLIDAIKLAFRWTHCVGCRACETSCPTGAIRVLDLGGGKYRPVVNAGTCIHCKLCIDNCPLADVTVERIYSALILDDPVAWRRPGRRTHESVIWRYLRLKGYKIEENAKILDADSLVSPAEFFEKWEEDRG